LTSTVSPPRRGRRSFKKIVVTAVRRCMMRTTGAAPRCAAIGAAFALWTRTASDPRRPRSPRRAPLFHRRGRRFCAQRRGKRRCGLPRRRAGALTFHRSAGQCRAGVLYKKIVVPAVRRCALGRTSEKRVAPPFSRNFGCGPRRGCIHGVPAHRCGPRLSTARCTAGVRSAGERAGAAF
jgi:hypothetical protein